MDNILVGARPSLTLLLNDLSVSVKDGATHITTLIVHNHSIAVIIIISER